MPSVLMVHASSDLYGSDLACLRVARGAVDAGWDVEVTLPWPGPLEGELQNAGARTRLLDPLKFRRADLAPRRLRETAGRWGRNLAGLRALARERRFDVVYTTTAPTTGGSFLAHRWRSGHVYHVHELFWYPRPLVAPLEHLLAAADVVICCSRAVRDQFRLRRLLDRCRVAYTGIDVDPGIEESPPLTGPGAELLCVARLNEWKGQEVLVDAVAHLRSEGRNVRLRLVGDVYRSEHHFRERLRAQIENLGLEDAVTLDGERRDAEELIGRCDVFVLPSRRPEPFGMALVEAMALGRPVVGTAAGGPAEVVTDGLDGLLVAPGDTVALAGAIRRLLDDPAWARSLAERGRERARLFPSSAMVDTVLAAFDESRHARHSRGV